VDEKEVVIEQEAEQLFHDLDVLLILALTRKFHGKTNKRAVKEKIKDIWARTQPIVQRGVLKGMYYMKTDELDRNLNWFISDYMYYSIPATQLGAQGYSGYAIYDKTVYPVEVTYESEEDFLWAIRNIEEIRTKVCTDLLWEFCREPGQPREVKADVLMFQNCGYDGLPKHWGIKMNDDAPISIDDMISPDCETPTFRYRPTKLGKQA
jgi:hypothetical protein